MITLADLVIIVFLAGLTGHYVFVTVFVRFVSTLGVLKKTTNKDTQKAENKPPNEEKVPTEETINVFIENEMEMNKGNKENAEDDKVESTEAFNTESGEVVKNKEKDIESHEEEPMAENTVESAEASKTVQVESPELEKIKEKDIESQESEPTADAKTESSETSTAVESEETREKDIESQKERLAAREEVEEGRDKESKDGKSKVDDESEKQPAKINLEEDFLFTAAVCSTWIPTVVGNQEQKIYLKAGKQIS